MHVLYSSQVASVTDLKRQYAKVMSMAEDGPVAVLNNNKPEAYLLTTEYFERLMDLLEDLQDAEVVRQRADGPYIDVTLEDLKNGRL